VLLLVIVVAVLLWRARKRDNRLEGKFMGSNGTVTETTSGPEDRSHGRDVTPPPGAVSPRNNTPSRQQILQDAVERANIPVRFYGKVVDQQGMPLADVNVRAKVRHWYIPSGSAVYGNGHMVRIDRVTDVDGQFLIEGTTGDALDFESISKDDYELSQKALHTFNPVNDPNKPTEFKMWKRGPKASLVSGAKVFGIVSDGRFYTIDLLHGKKTEGAADQGDLRVSIVRPGNVNPKDKFTWSFVIEAIEGGLIPTDDEFMYLAPENGYERRFEMNLRPDGSDWTPLVKKQLFVRSRNGQLYGRLQVEVIAVYNDQSAIEINYAINPNSSRNLQP
jgi:hypothetical protein